MHAILSRHTHAQESVCVYARAEGMLAGGARAQMHMRMAHGTCAWCMQAWDRPWGRSMPVVVWPRVPLPGTCTDVCGTSRAQNGTHTRTKMRAREGMEAEGRCALAQVHACMDSPVGSVWFAQRHELGAGPAEAPNRRVTYMMHLGTPFGTCRSPRARGRAPDT